MGASSFPSWRGPTEENAEGGVGREVVKHPENV